MTHKKSKTDHYRGGVFGVKGEEWPSRGEETAFIEKILLLPDPNLIPYNMSRAKKIADSPIEWFLWALCSLGVDISFYADQWVGVQGSYNNGESTSWVEADSFVVALAGTYRYWNEKLKNE